ncbi:hypothetical protein DWW78_10375 [Alistipes indistinctus]|nr:hypothetical protein DWW78_10375 [Alistipes indistinctus]
MYTWFIWKKAPFAGRMPFCIGVRSVGSIFLWAGSLSFFYLFFFSFFFTFFVFLFFSFSSRFSVSLSSLFSALVCNLAKRSLPFLQPVPSVQPPHFLQPITCR